MKIGLAKSVITPPVGIELPTYGGRIATSVRDDLFCRAVVLESEGKRASIIVNDLTFVRKELVEATRRIVEIKTGIPRNYVLVSATHTHSAPQVGDGFSAKSPFEPEIDWDYIAILPKMMAGTVLAATKNMNEAKINVGKGSIDFINFNRAAAGGPIDPEVGVIRIDDNYGKIISLLVNFACHPVVIHHHDTTISADYPGRVVSIIESVKPGAMGIFLQGASGNINPIAIWTNNLDHPGVSLACEALKVGERISWENRGKNLKLVAAIRKIKLPLRIPSEDEVVSFFEKRLKKLEDPDWEDKHKNDVRPSKELNQKRYEKAMDNLKTLIHQKPETEVETEIQVLQIGDFVLAAVPCELFCEFGMEIKRKSPCKNTFVVSCANDIIPGAYVPIKEEFPLEGYGAISGFIRGFLPFSPEVGEVLTNSMLDLIKDVYIP